MLPGAMAGDESSGEPLRYVCMPGCPYTGSTLLGFLLNAHPHCASIGAATGLIPGTDLETYTCSCGVRFIDCPFWLDVAERTRALGEPVDPFQTNYWSTHFAPTRNRYLDALMVRNLRSPALESLRDGLIGRLPPVRARTRATERSSWALARSILDITGKKVFVDTSRDHQRPKLLGRAPELEVRVIHLVRDARANTASILKHQTTGDVAQAARMWKRANLQADQARRHVPDDHWLRIRYDELCADLQGSMDRISDALGVPRAPIPGDFRAVPNHIIGNEMRLTGAGQVHEDVSWKQRLTETDLAVIAREAGAANRSFGFAWPEGPG